MHLGLLSHGQLTFDPFKPIILRGLPTEDASTLFAGNVVLTLSRPTKITNVTVTLKSQAITYWPEGIGSRGTRLTAEKKLGEHTLEILAPNQQKNASFLVLPAGTHRFSFAFIIPNSTVESIEDTFGRVRHVVEAEVQRPGIVMLSNWHISKPVMILRTYMSNSLLTNNSLQSLSRTFEKHMPYGDIEVVVEAAAFSSGDLFYIRMIIEPQLKHTRLEHMEVNVTETRRYCVPDLRAWRNETTTFSMPFAGSVRLAEFGEVDVTSEQLAPIFDKCRNGIELVHDFAHRLAFFAPTCQQNIRHTTYIKEILFRHHIEINLTLSYLDSEGNRHLSRHSSQSSITTDSSAPPPSTPSLSLAGSLTPPPAAHVATNTRSHNPPTPLESISRFNNSVNNRLNRHIAAIENNNNTTTTSNSTTENNSNTEDYNNNPTGWSNVLLRLNRTKVEKNVSIDGRQKETISLDTPITVFNCRLKEDYGKLPSYFELGVKPVQMSNKKKNNSNNNNSYNPSHTTTMDKPNRPHPYLCSCYYAFCREMELASQALYLSTETAPAMPLLDRIPSIPPPDYYADLRPHI